MLTLFNVFPSTKSTFETRDHAGERWTWRATPLRTLTTAEMSSKIVVTPRDVEEADMTPLYKFLLDFMFWSQHVHPQKNTQAWPVGKITSHLSIANALRPAVTQQRVKHVDLCTPTTPPTVAMRVKEIMRLTESDAWNMYMPFVQCADDLVSTTVPMWTAALVHTGTKLCSSVVPISDSIHEDTQLRYGRKDIPLCALGDQCAATMYPGNQGPLHVYMLPTVAAAHHAGKSTYIHHDEHATCLLCVRRDVHGACLAWEAMVPNPTRQIQRSSIIPPPFTNLVDVPAGYKKSAFLPMGEALFDNANVVGVTGELSVKYDTKQCVFFFDQERIKCRPASFLCQNTATSSL